MVCRVSGLRRLYTERALSGMGSLSLLMSLLMSLSLSLSLSLSEEEDLRFRDRRTSKREEKTRGGEIYCQTRYIGSYIRRLKSLTLADCPSRSTLCKYMPTAASHLRADSALKRSRAVLASAHYRDVEGDGGSCGASSCAVLQEGRGCDVLGALCCTYISMFLVHSCVPLGAYRTRVGGVMPTRWC